MNRIMEKPEVFKSIRTVLATLFSDTIRARRVIHDAGLTLAHISFAGSANDVWFEALDEADKQNKVQSLLNMAIEDYPDNTALRSAFEEFSRWESHQQKGERTDERLVEDVKAEGLSLENLTHTGDKDIGISFDDQGKSIISVTPTEFFDSRLRSAFPGIRGLHWFENPIDALDRLEIFFRKPLMFDKGSGYDVATDPIWLFRDLKSMYIRELYRTSEPD